MFLKMRRIMLPASDVLWPSECGESEQEQSPNPLWANDFLVKTDLKNKKFRKKRLQDE
jgi:hypothetical protein